MGLMPEVRLPARCEARGTTRLVWGVLLVWLSPVILLVIAVGLVGMAASGSFTLAAKIAPGRASALPVALAKPMDLSA